MFRPSLEDGTAMLFQWDQDGPRSFWMDSCGSIKQFGITVGLAVMLAPLHASFGSCSGKHLHAAGHRVC